MPGFKENISYVDVSSQMFIETAAEADQFGVKLERIYSVGQSHLSPLLLCEIGAPLVLPAFHFRVNTVMLYYTLSCVYD